MNVGLVILAGVMRAANIKSLRGDDWQRLKAAVFALESVGVDIGCTAKFPERLYACADDVLSSGMINNKKFRLKDKYRRIVEGVE